MKYPDSVDIPLINSLSVLKTLVAFMRTKNKIIDTW